MHGDTAHSPPNNLGLFIPEHTSREREVLCIRYKCSGTLLLGKGGGEGGAGGRWSLQYLFHQTWCREEDVSLTTTTFFFCFRLLNWWHLVFDNYNSTPPPKLLKWEKAGCFFFLRFDGLTGGHYACLIAPPLSDLIHLGGLVKSLSN